MSTGPNKASMCISTAKDYIIQGVNSNDFLFFIGNSNQSMVYGISNANQLLTIKGSGKVGINCSNPIYSLDVTGAANFTSNVRTPFIQMSNALMFSSNSNIGFGGQSNPAFTVDILGDLNFSGKLNKGGLPYIGSQFSNNGLGIYLLGSNVGVGTINPQAPLHVASNIQVDHYIRMSNALIYSSNSNIGFGGQSNPNFTVDILGNLNFTGSLNQGGKLYVGSQFSNVGKNVYITNSNLGIGTANPLAPLHVASNIQVDHYIRMSNAFIYSSNSNMGFGGQSNPAFTVDILGNLNLSGSLNQGGMPYIGSQFSNVGKTVYILNSNIGIGTSTPQAPLHVASNMRVDGAIQMNGALQMTGFEFVPGAIINNSSQLILATSNIQGYSNISNGTLLSIPGSTDTDSFKFVTGSTSNEVARITGNGMLGVGTSAPTCTLDVNGSINYTSNLTKNGNVYINRLSSTGGVIVTVYDDLVSSGNFANIFGGRPTNSGIVSSFNYPDLTQCPIVLAGIRGTLSAYSLKFMGYMMVSTTDTYTFGIGVDDQFELYINQNLLCYSYLQQPVGVNQYTGTITLQANIWYPLCILYINSTGNSGLVVNWKNTTTQTSYVNLSHGQNGISLGYDTLENTSSQFSRINVAGTTSVNQLNVRGAMRTIGISTLGSNVSLSNNSGIVSIASSGTNLGVGTLTPGYTLDVAGNVNFTGNLTKSGVAFSSASVWNSNSSNVYVGTGSNVGIGMSNPAYTLDVNGNTNISSNLTVVGDVSLGSSLTVMGKLTACNIQYVTSNITVFSSEVINSNLNVYQMTTMCNVSVLSNMNMKTTGCAFSNAGNLQVSGNVSLGSSLISTVSTGTAPFIISSTTVVPNLNVGLLNGTSAYALIDNPTFTGSTSNSGNLSVGGIMRVFGTSTFGSNIGLCNSSGIVNIASSGTNLGVGTLTPGYTLDVAGNVNFTGNLTKNGVAFTSGNVSVWNSNGSNVYLGTGSNVGIGMSNPAYTLDVAGNINMTGNLTKNGVAFTSGNVSVWSSNNSNVYVGTGSNVGIGKSNPAYTLDVAGNVNFTGNLTKNGVAFSSGSGSSVWSNNNSNVFIVGSNLGVGTSSPAYTLDVLGNVNFTGNLTTNGTQYLQFTGSGNGGTTYYPPSALANNNSTVSGITYTLTATGNQYSADVGIYQVFSPSRVTLVVLTGWGGTNGVWNGYQSGTTQPNKGITLNIGGYTGGGFILNFNQSIVMNGYQIKFAIGVTMTYYIFGSPDNTNWTLLKSVTSATLATNQLYSISFTNTTPYNYYSWICTQQGNGDLYFDNFTFTYTSPPASVNVNGTLTKTAGSFDIPHVNPTKATLGYRLRHCFVESPTRGDNVYRFKVKATTNNYCEVIMLDDYWCDLNENPQVWVSRKDGFGHGYGNVDETQSSLTVHCEFSGIYDVLLIGTRKDEAAIDFFDRNGGVEYIK